MTDSPTEDRILKRADPTEIQEAILRFLIACSHPQFSEQIFAAVRKFLQPGTTVYKHEVVRQLWEMADEGKKIIFRSGFLMPRTPTETPKLQQPMTEQHQITPPPELLNQWKREWVYHTHNPATLDEGTYIATQAARWGADQELEACCEWLAEHTRDAMAIEFLRDARRPQPPTQKEQALRLLETYGASAVKLTPDQCDIIRRALGAIPTDTQ
jgi:hypothetical protein